MKISVGETDTLYENDFTSSGSHSSEGISGLYNDIDEDNPLKLDKIDIGSESASTEENSESTEAEEKSEESKEVTTTIKNDKKSKEEENEKITTKLSKTTKKPEKVKSKLK